MTKIKKFSKKGAALNTKITKAKRWVVENREPFCEACGSNQGPLDCSHTLSVRERKDLADDTDNILLVCRGCHQKIETFDIEGMNCEDQIREYVELNDSEYYRRKMLLYNLVQFLVVTKAGFYTTNNVDRNLMDAAMKNEAIIFDIENKLVLNPSGEWEKPEKKRT